MSAEGSYTAAVTFRFIGYGTPEQAEKTIKRMLNELRLVGRGVQLVSRSIDYEGETLPAIYRTGRTVPYTIYLQLGEHPSDDDVFIAAARTADMATGLVSAANGASVATELERDDDEENP